ncbi:MAG TPA: hypothetical protein VEJ47_00125 [Candidatus Eremiobacteraceae bacterium]|nr:hypothetical protein [Candidatus Eremiobacteraceae bacterium]
MSTNKNHIDPAVSSGSSPGDFAVHNHGSIILLEPLSVAAFQWIEDHLPEDRLTFGNSVCIEPRYLGPILEGIKDEGLVCR